MKQRQATITLENVMEAVAKDVAIENLPDLAPVSDTSASSACSCFPENAPSTRSQSGSVEQLDSDASQSGSVEQLEEEVAFTEADEGSEKRERKVHWGFLEMRFFPIIPGDHPDAQGVPVRFQR